MTGRASVPALFLAFSACVHAPEDAGPVVRAGSARFTVIAPECVRIEHSATGRFIDAPSMFATERNAAAPRFTVERDGPRTTIDTGRIRLLYTDDGAPPGPGNLKAVIRGGTQAIVWTPAAQIGGNLGGTLASLEGARGPLDLGEGLLSRDGWIVLDDSTTPLLTPDGWVEARPQGAGLDWYLFGYAHDYPAALRALTTVSGKVPLPRRYALGSWYSWYWPLRSDDYRRIVEEYREHDFPLDIVVMDTDWHRGGWTGWSWNRDLLPDAEDLLQWFHRQGLAVTLNSHPAGGVGREEEAYVPLMRALGQDPASGQVLPFDASDRRYLEAFFETTHAPLERAGVDFWWIDWQQTPMTRGVAGLRNLTWLNDRYFRRSENGGRRGQILSRFAGWGDHRNAIHFSGDAEGRWTVLRFEVPFSATAGNAGCFFWSHDIGGHSGRRDEEMFTRWVQFGALSAALRLHSTRLAELDRRPWTYGRPFEEAMRAAFHLRARLFPYLYSTAWRSHVDSVPLLRPLYLDRPEDQRAYANPQEYLLGEALLVAPVTDPGVGPGRLATQAVWFPPGRWHDWFTGEVYEGGEEVIVAAGLDEIPLFVREGVPIPMQPPTQRMSASPPPELLIRCAPGMAGRFTLYEDDGITTEYRRGGYATTDLTCARQGERVTVSVAAARGTFRDMPRERSYVIELAGTARPRAARINGQEAPFEYDAPRATTRIRVPSRARERGVSVEALAAPADAAALREAAAARRRRLVIGNASPDRVADGVLLGGAYAALGTALHRKNEGLNLRGGPEVLIVQDRAHLIDGGYTLTVEERAGPRSREVLRHRGRGPARFPLPEFPLLEDTTVGVPLVRDARLEFTSRGRPVSILRLLDRRASALRRWRIAGPFPYDPAAPLAAQSAAPENGPVDLAASYAAADPAGPAVWKAIEARDDGAVDLRAVYKHDNRIAYAVTFLRSPRAQPATVRVWSDDGVEAWIGGRKIHTHDGVRPLEFGPDEIRAEFRKGVNTLLLKVSNTDRAWGFRVEVETKEALTEVADPMR